jgi:hypothetical protein
MLFTTDQTVLGGDAEGEKKGKGHSYPINRPAAQVRSSWFCK